MDRLRPYPVAVFAAVTLFIWGNRIWLAWTQRGVGLGAKLALSIPITAFVVMAVVVLTMLVTGVDRDAAGFRFLVRVFAAGTAIFWAVRLPMIEMHRHPVPFKLVHATLAIASVAAAVFAWRALDVVADGSGPDPDTSAGRRHTDALV